MAEAEQQIDVGGPGADAVQRGQRVMRGVGVLFRQYVEVQPLGGQFARDVLQRLDLGGGKTEPAETVGARLADGIVIERIERFRQPSPDRPGACGRQLLAADDSASPAKPGSRCRSAGMPVSSRIGFSRRSCLTSAAMASSRSDWVLRWMVIAP